jgi:RHS repeat-associated protein
MIRGLRCSSLILVSFALFTGIVRAQVTTGTPSFGSFGGGPDVINLANLNSHITVPVLHKPGRGMNFNYDLVYDSSVWNPVTSGSTVTWNPVFNFGWKGGVSGAAVVGYVSYSLGSLGYCFTYGGMQVFFYQFTNFAYRDSWGLTHPIPGQIISESANIPVNQLEGCHLPSPSYSISGTLTDASGLTYSLSTSWQTATYISSGTIWTPSGSVLTPPLGGPSGSGIITDRNGNEITSNGSGNFYDTISSTTPVLTVSGSGTPSSPMKFTYTSSSGGSPYYQVNFTNYTVATNFGVSGIHEYKSSAAVALVTSIVLPDNSQYNFTYETTPGTCTPYAGTTCVTARITSIQLPTGGKIAYAYSNGNNGILPDGSTATLTRTTPDGTWIYARTLVSGTQWQTIITDPSAAANQTSIQFQGIYETQRKVYQGSTSGTLFQTINTCYNAASSPCTTTAITLPITVRTTLATVPGPGNLIAQHTDRFDSYGNSTEYDDYDLATAAPFPLLRQTLITYAGLGGYLHSFRQTVKVLDGSGNIKSRQDTNYDQYSSFTGANCITGAPDHNDSSYGCSFTARANVTSVTKYTDPVTPGGAITKSYTYDSLGNVRTAQLNCCQLKTINYSATTEYAYPDSVVSGSSSPQLTSSATYDLHMGLTLTMTDPNSVTTTMTYDNSGRTLTTKVGTNPATNYTYNDYNNSTSFTPWTVQVCSPVQGTNTACQKKILDSQGRTVTAQVLDGSSNLYSAADTQYDLFGRAYKVSNPYTSSASYWTQIGFDVLGRTITTMLADNSVSSISYADNTVTTTDPAGKQRMGISDGLGRLTSVKEPDPLNSNTLTLTTSYTYNVSGQLLTVTSPAQTRTNVYDALGRLTSYTTPEGGTVCYGTVSGGNCQANTGYDFYNNLIYRTDARGVVTSYLYDDLNRLVGITYPTVPSGVSAMPNICKVNGASSNNANVCYTYGTTATGYQNGRVISINDPSGSETYSYDQFGDVTQLAKIIGANTYTTNYTYNLASELTQITYPSGRVVQQSVDAIGRLCEIAPTTTGCGTAASPFATGFGYNTANRVTGFKYGNGIFASFGFSPDRLQLNCLDYSTTNRGTTCTHDSTTKFGLGYSYQTAPSNNGQISGITDSVDSGRNATYTYDSLYRLTNTSTTGSANYPAWGLSETYDRYGNRSAQGASSGCTGITCPTNSVTINAATNQISGSPYAYDLAGNMTNDGLNTLVYDGENRAVSAAVSGSSSGTYTYDGKGLRVQKVSVVSGTSTTTVYVFSNSKVIAEYDNGALPSAPTREYIYAGAKLLTKIDTTGTKYYHQDHLSNRLVTDSSGNTVTQMGHFPFGESWYNATKDKLTFTSYERDAESGNDYAKARYYISRLARFSTPDSVAGNPSNPQSWNRYTYVLNDPINLNDPEGEYCQWDDGSTDDEPEGGGASQDECYAQGGTWIDASQGGDGGGDSDPGGDPSGVIMKVLSDCIQSLYGITTDSFTAPQPGVNGSYIGSGYDANVDLPSQIENGPSMISITANATQYDMLSIRSNDACGDPERPLPMGESPGGCNRKENILGDHGGSYQYLVGSDLQTSMMPSINIIELGNALDVLSGTQTWDQAYNQDIQSNTDPNISYFQNAPGNRLLNCVNDGGPNPPNP